MNARDKGPRRWPEMPDHTGEGKCRIGHADESNSIHGFAEVWIHQDGGCFRGLEGGQVAWVAQEGHLPGGGFSD